MNQMKINKQVISNLTDENLPIEGLFNVCQLLYENRDKQQLYEQKEAQKLISNAVMKGKGTKLYAKKKQKSSKKV